MEGYKRIVVIILTIICLISSVISVIAKEPEKPEVNYTFSFEKESRINDVAVLSSKEAFNMLKGIEFIIDEQLLHAAIFRTFVNRKAEAIGIAVDALKLPLIEIKDGQMVNRGDDIYIARKIFEVFPDESVDNLLMLYKEGDAVARGNIIRASGNVSGQPIRDLLVKALDEKTFCEGEYPEMIGKPLRICDVAYNQLVLRYKIKDVLRTIGNEYKIETRDYHINILKSKL
ncbi:MAG: hypothetical protein IBX72_06105 [Nitrospirae bacterium]|nr:hypothetical protein [Nitrospirota bacterium]